ncbi:hypothetical protein QKU58_gp138 [Pyramimonas orientalis virus]|uniref:Uncharacterized protein n=1 Tax=Pyramimonas orientalis virus 01B TaxID=3134525 RepID=A0A7M3UNE4_9VIRU|nr:hypothetical protein QKU58_gp138 [Pyramimonas orientalis virus]QOI90193.1 hypothetical protein HWQ62_00056 [Pyramimonas orientalis virus]
MTSTIVPKFIITLFKGEIERIHKKLLIEIAKDYKLSIEELNSRYIPSIDINNDKIEIVRRRKYLSNLDDKNRCIAYNGKKKRCQRPKGANSTFCHAHVNSQRHGTLETSLVEDKPKQKYKPKLY